jgi:signal transduction histidine kinase
VWIEVADDGAGIPAAIMDKIFDPFFTTKPVGKGTGLGLSLSYGIVQKHNGRISVSSTPGVGTTFRITLPVHHQASVGATP